MAAASTAKMDRRGPTNRSTLGCTQLRPNRSFNRTANGRPVNSALSIGLHPSGFPGQSLRMAPTIVRDGQFRLFFFSREEPRIHVHVSHPDGEAKFWLHPDVRLAVNIGLSPTQVRQAQAVVVAHQQEIEDAWRHHFGS